MCDVNEDKLAALKIIEEKKKDLSNSLCMKCKVERPYVVVRGNDPLCKSCFKTYTTHKFRSTLGKARVIQANDKVLLALSTGHSSTAMLHLVKEALSQGAHKRLKFSPGVVFIDESAVLSDGTNHDISAITKLAECYEYPFYKLPIYQNFQNHAQDQTTEEDMSNIDRDQFCNAFSSIKTLSAKTEFVTNLRLSLIVDTAIKNGYQKIMIGENATTLSIKLLCNVAQGRGVTIPQDIGISDTRYESMIVRPMREFSSKEVGFYNRVHGINVNPVINLNTKQSNSASLQRQTEEFLLGLQAEFPSTVNIVFRTGDKICVHKDLGNSHQACVMCQAPLFLSDSTITKASDSVTGSCCGSSDECDKGKFRLTVNNVKEHLCYGCNLTFKDMGYDINLLPLSVTECISNDIKRSKMKDTIQDFLLE